MRGVGVATVDWLGRGDGWVMIAGSFGLGWVAGR